MLHGLESKAPFVHANYPEFRSAHGRRLGPANCRRFAEVLPVVYVWFAVAITIGVASFAAGQVWDGGAGTTDWHDANNWSPDGVPTSTSSPVLDASLTAPITVGLSANVIDVNGLTIADGFRLDTHGFALFVNDTMLTAMTEVTGAGSELIVDSNAAFDTDLFLVRANGRLNMKGGSAQMDDFAEIRANGLISGYGDVLLGGNSSSGILLDNKGSISVSGALGPFGGTLTISKWSATPPGTTLSLSGSTGTGTLTVNDNAAPLQEQGPLRLVIDGETEDFAGVLDIGRADTAEFVHDLQLAGGRIDFNGSTGTATLTGTGTIGSNGQIAVNSGTARIENVIGVGTGSTTDVAAGATLLLANTFTAGGAAAIDVGADATIQFDGTGNVFTGAPVQSFTLGDHAQLIVHGDLTLDAGTTFTFDWDGTNDTAKTEVRGPAARLSIIADSLLDDHDGDLTIADGGRVEVSMNGTAWRQNGNLTMSSSAGGTNTRLETLNAGRAVYKGDITATGDGTSVIDGEDNDFDSTVTVLVEPAATLRIRNAEIEGGGTWGDGNGSLQNSNSLLVNTMGAVPVDTTMNFQTVDLDGPGGEAIVTLHTPLLLNVANINDEAGNVFGQYNGLATTTTMTFRPEGRLDVSAADLADSNWTIGENATVILNASPGGSTQVSGANVLVQGTVQVLSGASRWDARTKIGDTGEVTIAAGASWALRGGSLATPNLMEGGSITGNGQLRSGDNTGLRGYGTISAEVAFNGFDRELLAADGTLNVNGAVTEVGRIGTANAAGTLKFGQGFNTQVANDALALNDGIVTGAAINNGGTTRGFGSITSSQFVQATAAGVTSATSGALTIDVVQPTVQISQGTLNAVDGDLIFMQPLASTFDGTVNVGAARRIEFQGGWNLSNGGQLNLAGGSGVNEAAVVGDTLINGGATVNVTDNGVFRDQVSFDAMSQVSLPATTDVLLLEGNALIPFNGAQTAAFSGNGALSNQAGSQLVIEKNVNSIGVDVRNRGTLELEQSAPGNVALNGNFVQFFSGITNLDIFGLSAGNQHDRLAVAGAATLDGTFAVTLGGGYAPILGDSYDLIDFSSASGTPAFLLPALGVGLTWDTSQFVSAGILAVTAQALQCDFDGSATCDLVDLNALLMEGPVAAGVTVTVGVNDQFDLNDDDTIDNTDVDLWLADAGSANGFASPYKRGDGNLDGLVDGQDFILWNLDKFTGSLRWDHGDFNGDGIVDGQDFITWNVNKFTSSDGLSTAVPEPSRYLLLVADLCWVCLVRLRVARAKTCKDSWPAV